jgi:hypothetical protein
VKRKLYILCMTVFGTAVTMLLAAQSALAQEEGGETGSQAEGIGENIANIIQAWTEPLLVAVAGMMAFAAFGQRQTGKLITVALTSIGVGGFVFAPDEIKSIVQSMWTVAGE